MFLTIITRCYKRPDMLARARASLAAQSCQDFEHVLQVDEVGAGIHEANRRLAEAEINGEYVYILDDDNELTDSGFVSDMKAIAREHTPDVIMVRSENGDLGTLPKDGVWGNYPRHGCIDMLNFVVSARVFRGHAAAFTHWPRCGDFTFISEVFKNGYSVHWHDKVVARIQRRSHGDPA